MLSLYALYLFIPIATAADTSPTPIFNLVNDFAANAAIFFNLFVLAAYASIFTPAEVKTFASVVWALRRGIDGTDFVNPIGVVSLPF